MIRPFLSCLRRDRAGAVAIEMAMTLPALLALLLGLMEVGRMVWTQAALSYAVQEAARCAAVRPGICGSAAQTRAYAAQQVAALSIPASAFTVATPACGSQVSAQVNHGFILYSLAPSAPALRAQACRA